MSHRDSNRDEDYKDWLEHGIRQGYIKSNNSADAQRGHSTGDAQALAAERPDYEIEDEIHDKLIHHKDLDASDIDVEVHHRDVTLKGYIDDKYQRRLAEELVASVPGVRTIVNLLTFKHFGFQGSEESKS